MATILRAPEGLTAKQRKAVVSLFLAGPFDPEDGWRDHVIEGCDDLDVVIIDPRNERWPTLEPGSPRQRGAYEWQCASAFEADVVIVWVPEGSHAPTALMILGYLGAKRNNAKRLGSVVVGGDGWDGLVKLFARNQRFFPVDGDLDEVVRMARLALKQAGAEKGVPLS